VAPTTAIFSPVQDSPGSPELPEDGVFLSVISPKKKFIERADGDDTSTAEDKDGDEDTAEATLFWAAGTKAEADAVNASRKMELRMNMFVRCIYCLASLELICFFSGADLSSSIGGLAFMEECSSGS